MDCVERLQAMMLARKLPYFNTKNFTLNLANLELGEGFRDFIYACELCGMKEEAALGKRFYRGIKGWPAGQPIWPKFLHYAPKWWWLS
jgi:hypothetical protein